DRGDVSRADGEDWGPGGQALRHLVGNRVSDVVAALLIEVVCDQYGVGFLKDGVVVLGWDRIQYIHGSDRPIGLAGDRLPGRAGVDVELHVQLRGQRVDRESRIGDTVENHVVRQCPGVRDDEFALTPRTARGESGWIDRVGEGRELDAVSSRKLLRHRLADTQCGRGAG